MGRGGMGCVVEERVVWSREGRWRSRGAWGGRVDGAGCARMWGGRLGATSGLAGRGRRRRSWRGLWWGKARRTRDAISAYDSKEANDVEYV